MCDDHDWLSVHDAAVETPAEVAAVETPAEVAADEAPAVVADEAAPEEPAAAPE